MYVPLCTAGANSWIEWCPSCLSTQLHSRYHTTSTVGGNISYLPHIHLILALCLATDIIVVFIVCYVTFFILSSLSLSTLISRAQCVTAGGPAQDECIHWTTLLVFIVFITAANMALNSSKYYIFLAGST